MFSILLEPGRWQPIKAKKLGSIETSILTSRRCPLSGIHYQVTSMSGLNCYIVSYDIREPERLYRVHKAMLGFGEPVQ
jgi:hypothetical protein